MHKNKNDRRIFERFDVDFSAKIKHAAAQRSNFARCCDIGAGGVGLLSEEKLIPDTDLEIWLGIPDGHSPFRRIARVSWSRQVQENKWRAGLKFQSVDFMGLRRIFKTMPHKGKLP